MAEDMRTLVPSWPDYTPHKGRHRLTETNFAALEAALKLDCTINEACAIAGMTRITYYKYWREEKWFRDRMQRAMDYTKILARAAVQHNIAKWDGKLALKYLQLRDKRMWTQNINDGEEEQQTQAPVVQFISVAPKSWNTTNLENQNPTMQSTPWDTSVTILESWTDKSENEIWENEEEILERLNLSTSSNE